MQEQDFIKLIKRQEEKCKCFLSLENIDKDIWNKFKQENKKEMFDVLKLLNRDLKVLISLISETEINLFNSFSEKERKQIPIDI